MNLQELIHGLDITSSVGTISREISGAVSNHLEVHPGYAFICYEGVEADGNTFIQEAIQNGAASIIGEKPSPSCLPPDVTYIQTPDGRIALSLIASNWYGNPADSLKLIGITGTNGKTSTAHLVHSIFKVARVKCAVMGSVGHHYGDISIPNVTTTPDALALHELFSRIANAAFTHVVMEASSQGLAQYRLAGLTFETAVFTNLSQDHLDYHHTMENYLRAKLILFEQLRSQTGLAVLNVDDPVSNLIRQQISQAVNQATVFTYGFNAPADLTVNEVNSTLKGLEFTATTPLGKLRVKLGLLGDYNLHNALAAIGVALHHGCTLGAIQEGLESTIVPGRFEQVNRGQDFTVVVDYAHTPDGLKNLLTAARKLTKGRLICAFGCGGDRDRRKRPRMATICAAIADHSVITSDNPRTENADSIIADIVKGLPKHASYSQVTDRREAIGCAIGLANPGDLVAIAGKGHESYQEIKGQRLQFDDREVAAQFLEQLRFLG